MLSHLSLVQLNIERDKHLEQVTNFLAANTFDVACLQELLESNISSLELAMNAKCLFAPMGYHKTDHSRQRWGVGIFSRPAVKKEIVESYAQRNVSTASFDPTEPEIKYTLVCCDIEKEGVLFRIATTHFPWTSYGQADAFQRESVQTLMRSLKSHGDLVICGDFNAPRGGEIFSIVTKQFTDNIPSEYVTSIDGALHRAGPLELMVDGIFSTSSYRVSNVERKCGLSDHCAFTALIERV